MSTIPTAIHDQSLDTGAKAPQRRKREELEALAAEFVNSKIHVKQPARRPSPALLGGAAAALFALLGWLLWPQADVTSVRDDSAAAAVEAEAWAKRLEAERERKRRELQSSRDYLAKMAASDSALLADMTSRAQALEKRADAAPAPGSGEPTPRTAEPTPRAEPAAAAAAPARQDAPPATTASAAPASAAPAPAAQPQAQVAQAAPASCTIHVSELSGSGKLTYADVARMKGTRTDGRGHLFTPPVTAANGRTVVFEVMPNGCVRIARTNR